MYGAMCTELWINTGRSLMYMCRDGVTLLRRERSSQLRFRNHGVRVRSPRTWLHRCCAVVDELLPDAVHDTGGNIAIIGLRAIMADSKPDFDPCAG